MNDMENEKLKAVIAECERLLNGSSKCDLYQGAFLKKELDGLSIYHYWGSDQGNATGICSISTRGEKANNPQSIELFYRLLGLDCRPLVAALEENLPRLKEVKEEAAIDFYGTCGPCTKEKTGRCACADEETEWRGKWKSAMALIDEALDQWKGVQNG